VGAGQGHDREQALENARQVGLLFRPGYIQPMKGVRSKTSLYQTMYTVLAPLYPVWKVLFPGLVTTTEKVGLAKIRVVERGYSKPLLENRDINDLAVDSD
jgi:hypothetical protein